MAGLDADVIKQVHEALTLLDSENFVAANYKGGVAGLLLNNSFIERKGIKTNKADTYLKVPIVAGMPGTPATLDVKSVGVITPKKGINLPQHVNFDVGPPMPLAQAVKAQRRELGKLVLILIGVLDKTLTCETDIAWGALDTLRFDPSAAQDHAVDIASRTVTTRRLGDLGALQASVEAHLPAAAAPNVRDALAAALEKIEDEAVVRVLAPARTKTTLARSLLGELAGSLGAERKDYAKALAAYKKKPSDEAQNELLRIAYNFASDATKIIHLLVCIADLKPAVLWLTVASHIRLAQAFQALPWQSNVKKPSLEDYRDVIANARNRAFHNLFAFNRTLDVDVSKVTLQALQLRLFRPYAGRNAASALKYKDQELVDVLSDFSRAPERTLDDVFLTANSRVMEETESLTRNTAEALLKLSK